MDDKQVVVYGDDAATRTLVIDIVGMQPDPALAPLNFIEIATAAALLVRVHAGDVDLLILDGEAAPAGGFGMARQLRDEVNGCPPIVLLTGRPADVWLAKWSTADATVPWPADPIGLSAVVVRALLTPIPSQAIR